MPSNDATQNNLSDDEVINLFIDGIMEEKGINPPTDEIRQDIHNNLKNQLLTEIDRSLVAELPDDQLEKFAHLAATEGEVDPGAIATAIQEANLDVAEITGITMQRFRELYLSQKSEGQPLTAQAEA